MTTVAVGVPTLTPNPAVALRWLPDHDPALAIVADWLLAQDDTAVGPDLAALRATCPHRVSASTGTEPLELAELDAAFLSGYAHPNFRDLIDRGHSRLLAGSPRWAPLYRSNRLVAIAATEPGGGSALANLATTATPINEGWLLNGHKSWISRMAEAEAAVIFAKDPEGQPMAFATALPNEAIAIQPVTPSGLVGWSWSLLTIDGLRVEAEDRLETSFSIHFARYRTIVAAVVAGATARCLDLLVESWPDSRRSAAAERVGTYDATIRASIAFVRSQATTTPVPRHGKLIKAFVVDHCLAVIRDALAISGAVSFQAAHPVRRRLHDLEAFQYADGPTDALYRSAARTR